MNRNTVIDSYQKLPPRGAFILFNGVDLNNWITRKGRPAQWTITNKMLDVVPGAGDIMTIERWLDFYLHLKFRCSNMPGSNGQDKSNSDVYLQGRYELQILDSYGVRIPGKRDCGAVYNQIAPLLNASKPPITWQTYDVIFRSARLRGSQIESPASLTAFQNGQVIHNNARLDGVTGEAIDGLIGQPGPILLQDHGDPVSFRNIWAVSLPLRDSDACEPR
jgi:hypothetical protein